LSSSGLSKIDFMPAHISLTVILAIGVWWYRKHKKQ
jgi:hypothetical protein